MTTGLVGLVQSYAPAFGHAEEVMPHAIVEMCLD